MRKFRVLWFAVACLGLLTNRGNAGVVTQTFNFTDTQSAIGSGVLVHSSPSGVSFNVNPFDSTLGTLNSFSFDWSFDLTASGTTSSAGGSINIAFGGTTYVDSTPYNGIGDGDGAGGPPNTPLGPLLATASLSNSFLPSNAGVTYDPNILALVTGSSQFSMTYFDSHNDIAYNNYSTMASVSSTFTTDLIVRYNYTAAVPEPSFMAMGATLVSGLVFVHRRRRATQKSV